MRPKQNPYFGIFYAVIYRSVYCATTKIFVLKRPLINSKLTSLFPIKVSLTFLNLLILNITSSVAYDSICRHKTSRPEVFCKKDVLINFTKLTGKHLSHSLSFNKVADLRPATLLKKIY